MLASNTETWSTALYMVLAAVLAAWINIFTAAIPPLATISWVVVELNLLRTQSGSFQRQSSQPIKWLLLINKKGKPTNQIQLRKSKQCKIHQNKTTLVQSPLTTLGHETRRAYSTKTIYHRITTQLGLMLSSSRQAEVKYWIQQQAKWKHKQRQTVTNLECVVYTDDATSIKTRWRNWWNNHWYVIQYFSSARSNPFRTVTCCHVIRRTIGSSNVCSEYHVLYIDQTVSIHNRE